MALGLRARAVVSSPEVMMGEMPSSMSVPRLEASRTLPERATRTGSVAMRPHLGGGTLHAEWCGVRRRSPHPVEGIGTLVSLAAVDGDLAADQENEQGDRGPQDLLLRFAGDQEWTLCTEALKLRCVLPRARGTG